MPVEFAVDYPRRFGEGIRFAAIADDCRAPIFGYHHGMFLLAEDISGIEEFTRRNNGRNVVVYVIDGTKFNFEY